MKKFLCKEIMCGHCVSRIQKGLTEAGIEHSVDLESKVVSVPEEHAKKAIEILDDLGFSIQEFV